MDVALQIVLWAVTLAAIVALILAVIGGIRASTRKPANVPATATPKVSFSTVLAWGVGTLLGVPALGIVLCLLLVLLMIAVSMVGCTGYVLTEAVSAANTVPTDDEEAVEEEVVMPRLSPTEVEKLFLYSPPYGPDPTVWVIAEKVKRFTYKPDWRGTSVFTEVNSRHAALMATWTNRPLGSRDAVVVKAGQNDLPVELGTRPMVIVPSELLGLGARKLADLYAVPNDAFIGRDSGDGPVYLASTTAKSANVELKVLPRQDRAWLSTWCEVSSQTEPTRLRWGALPRPGEGCESWQVTVDLTPTKNDLSEKSADYFRSRAWLVHYSDNLRDVRRGIDNSETIRSDEIGAGDPVLWITPPANTPVTIYVAVEVTP